MWNNLFKHIDIDSKNARIYGGNAADLQTECDAFEKKKAGETDQFVGGHGPHKRHTQGMQLVQSSGGRSHPLRAVSPSQQQPELVHNEDVTGTLGLRVQTVSYLKI